MPGDAPAIMLVVVPYLLVSWVLDKYRTCQVHRAALASLSSEIIIFERRRLFSRDYSYLLSTLKKMAKHLYGRALQFYEKRFTWSGWYQHESKLKLGRGGISGDVPIRLKNTQV